MLVAKQACGDWATSVMSLTRETGRKKKVNHEDTKGTKQVKHALRG